MTNIKVTNKENNIESIVNFNGEYYTVVDSEVGGLDKGTTYSGKDFMELMKGFETEVV